MTKSLASVREKKHLIHAAFSIVLSYTTMTDAVTWAFDIDPYIKRLKTPIILVHGDMSDGGPAASKHMFDAIQSDETKQLAFYKNTMHTQFDEDPTVIDRAVADVVDFFAKILN